MFIEVKKRVLHGGEWTETGESVYVSSRYIVSFVLEEDGMVSFKLKDDPLIYTRKFSSKNDALDYMYRVTDLE